tara:strand:- start:1329 stop:2969 length:1641 start_codon:yes stop_codon:yes gene_type:complete
MAIKRYTADADTTITNAYKANLTTRGTGSNMGLSDVLTTFSIYGQASGSTDGYSQELSRILIKFPVATMSADRTAGTVPASGSIAWYLRMFNAKHSYTTPKDLILTISPLRQEWQEGNGLDMESYKDLTYDGVGANWLRARSGSLPAGAGLISWDDIGGTYFGDTDPTTSYDASFPEGIEDLELDISELVEQWISGAKSNYGVMVKLTGSQEAYAAAASATAIILNTTGSKESYYTKKFFARGSEYFFKRPCIEARFDESNRDDRGNFFYSSSLSDGDGNTNTLFLYNYVRGNLANIPGIATDYTGEIYVSFFSGSKDNSKVADRQEPIQCVTTTDFVQANNPYVVTGGYVETGIYSASICLTSALAPLNKMFDVWFTGSHTIQSSVDPDGTIYTTGSFVPDKLDTSPIYATPRYTTTIQNLQPSYSHLDKPRLRAFIRELGADYNIYVTAQKAPQNQIIENAYYKVYRITDDTTAIAYGTGSSPGASGATSDYTRLSFDVSGSYFDLDVSLLEQGFAYGVKFVYYDGAAYLEQPEIFKFRVEDKL